MTIFAIIFGLLVLALIVSLVMAMHYGYKHPSSLPPAFPKQTNADIYKGL
jgi:hypothetical protein